MATIGILAPFIESLFKRAFKCIPYYFSQIRKDAENYSWIQKTTRNSWEIQKPISQGIQTISEDISLSQYFPNDYKTFLDVLFSYRNSVFHNGFEWEPEEDEKFREKKESNEWNKEWFSTPTSGGNIWMYNLTPLFVDFSLKTIDQIIEGFGKYYKFLFKE